jgi:hypothetical protein
MGLPAGWSRIRSKENEISAIDNAKDPKNNIVYYARHEKGYAVYVKYEPIWREVNETPYSVMTKYPDGEIIQFGTGKNPGYDRFNKARKVAVRQMKSMNRNVIPKETGWSR